MNSKLYKLINSIHVSYLYNTPKHKMGKGLGSSPDICSQCTVGSTDDYLHAIWDCQPVYSLWRAVTEKLKKKTFLTAKKKKNSFNKTECNGKDGNLIWLRPYFKLFLQGHGYIIMLHFFR